MPTTKVRMLASRKARTAARLASTSTQELLALGLSAEGAQQLTLVRQSRPATVEPSMLGMQELAEQDRSKLQLGAPSVMSTTKVSPESLRSVSSIFSRVGAAGVPPSTPAIWRRSSRS